MEISEVCLGQLTGNCPNPATKNGPSCQVDDETHKGNEDCPYYKVGVIRYFNVIDPVEQVPSQ